MDKFIDEETIYVHKFRQRLTIGDRIVVDRGISGACCPAEPDLRAGEICKINLSICKIQIQPDRCPQCGDAWMLDRDIEDIVDVLVTQGKRSLDFRWWRIWDEQVNL